MIKHVVMWKLREGLDKPATVSQMKARLEGLVGQVEGLHTLEVGLSFTGGFYDACLVSLHSDREALAVYATHPAHLEIKKFVHSVIEARESCDFEI